MMSNLMGLWGALVAGIVMQIPSGNGYNFPLYSGVLKQKLELSTRQLTMLGVANALGENSGIVILAYADTFSARTMIGIGAFMSLFGYGLLLLAMTEKVQFYFWMIWLMLFLATHSSAWFNTAVIGTNLANFPFNRGAVSSILKGYTAISAAMFAAVYTTLLHRDSSSLLMLLAVGIPLLCFLSMWFIKEFVPPPGNGSSEQGRFAFTKANLFVLGAFVVVGAVSSRIFHFSTTVSHVVVAIMFLLYMAPITIPIMIHFDTGNTQEMEEPLLSAADLAREFWKTVGRTSPCKDFIEAMKDANLWLLFLVYFAGVGSGVTVLNNLSQIGSAKEVEDTSILLSVFSFCNLLGRILGGNASDYAFRLKGLPRTMFFIVSQGVLVLAYLLLAFAIPHVFYLAIMCVGICYGIQFTIMIPTVSELFGLRRFSLYSNVISLANPLGALAFSVYLVGYVSNPCLGPDCFQVTFWVLAFVCFLGCLLSWLLTRRIRNVYEHLHHKLIIEERTEDLHFE